MTGEPIHITEDMVIVLHAFLDDPAAAWFGFDLMRATGLSSGALYLILARLERFGWLTTSHESVADAHDRPVRRRYQLSTSGLRGARIEMANDMTRRLVRIVPVSRGLVGGTA